MASGKTKEQLEREAQIGREIKEKTDQQTVEQRRRAQNGKK
jgi:hypothetical protein